MAKTKINAPRTDRTPNAFYVSAMRTTDNRNAGIETENAQWLQMAAKFHTTFQALDDAYQRSQMSFSTQTIAEKDEERDVWGGVIEQVAKQWARMPDETMALHGRRVYQVFQDIGYRASEALVAQNEKVVNIEQRFAEAALQLALQKMGLTEANQRFTALTQEIINLMAQRNEESSTRVQGELKAAREAMDAVYADFVELTNAYIVTNVSPELETLAQVLNAEYKKIEEQMAQSKKLPTVLVKSDIVGRSALPLATNGTQEPPLQRARICEVGRHRRREREIFRHRPLHRLHRLAGRKGQEGRGIVPRPERRGREADRQRGCEEGV